MPPEDGWSSSSSGDGVVGGGSQPGTLDASSHFRLFVFSARPAGHLCVGKNQGALVSIMQSQLPYLKSWISTHAEPVSDAALLNGHGAVGCGTGKGE